MNKKIHTPILALILLCIPSFLISQTAEEIIAKHIDAHGGKKNFEQLKTLKLTGTFTGFSLEKDFTCYKSADGKYYADFHLGEKHVIEAYDGEKGWTVDPWQEMDYARKLGAAERNVLMQKADFISPFFTYKAKGEKVEYLGLDTIDGMQMHAMKINRKNGKAETWYLDAKTYLAYHCTSEWVDFMRPLPSESYFDDYREVKGMLIPHYISRTFWQRDRVWQLESIESIDKFDNTLLKMPRRKEIDKLSFLEGTWDVKVEAWTRRGTWYPMGTTESSIEYSTTNMLREEIAYERSYPINKHSSFTWVAAHNNYRITVFNDFTSEIDVFEGNFTDSTFVFDDLSVSYLDSSVQKSQHTCYIIQNWTDKGFTLQRQISVDKGKKWYPRDQFTYTRKED